MAPVSLVDATEEFVDDAHLVPMEDSRHLISHDAHHEPVEQIRIECWITDKGRSAA